MPLVLDRDLDRFVRVEVLEALSELIGVVEDAYRISVTADRMGGQPCVRDLRFPVSSVVAMVADGMTVAEITAEHPDLEPDDITQCLRFAAAAVQERALPLRSPG